MKFALCNEVIRDLPFAAQCDFAAATGYDGLEIAPFTVTPDPRAITPGNLAALRRAMADAGVVCSSLHWLLLTPEGLSVTDADAGVRQRTTAVMLRLVDMAAALGARVLVHGSPKQRALVPGDEAGGRARARDILAKAAEHAAQAGVVYCIEPLAPAETDFVTSLAEAAELVAAVGNPAFAAMLDCSATGRAGRDPVAEIGAHLPSGLIRHVHVNDPNRRGPGEGEMRFAPILAALRAQEYSGWIGVEPFVYAPDGPACAARAIGYLRGLIEAQAL